MYLFRPFFVASLLFLSPALIFGAWIVKDGKIQDVEEAATLSCESHWRLASEAIDKGLFEEGAKQCWIVEKNFPRFSEENDCAFFLGVCLYENGEFDRADEAFSTYLKRTAKPRYFEETMTYKLQIADQFRLGARRRLLGYKKLPKISTGRTIALKIYDEVATAMPCHDYGAHALYCRGFMLWERGDYVGSIESFQLLIRRFPKHELTPEAFLSINRVYLNQAEVEYQNPDLLPLAEINLRRYAAEFPGDERISEAEADVDLLREIYAEGLFKTGCFYITQEKEEAAQIYFKKAIQLFPDTAVAEKCRLQLESFSR